MKLMTISLLLILPSAFMVSSMASPQTLNQRARELLASNRQLSQADIAEVLEGVRLALNGKAFRLLYGPPDRPAVTSPDQPGLDVQMGPAGRPRFFRFFSSVNSFDGGVGGTSAGPRSAPSSTGRERYQREEHFARTTVTEYTGLPARSCAGSALEGELVLEYEHRSSDTRWTVRARTRTVHELAATVFDMLTGEIPVESGDRGQVSGRSARAFTAPFESLASKAVQSLWIDTESMLPLRWSLSMPGVPDRSIPAIPDFGATFTYDASLDLQVPPGITKPNCVR
jgi:hypothetical protein